MVILWQHDRSYNHPEEGRWNLPHSRRPKLPPTEEARASPDTLGQPPSQVACISKESKKRGPWEPSQPHLFLLCILFHPPRFPCIPALLFYSSRLADFGTRRASRADHILLLIPMLLLRNLLPPAVLDLLLLNSCYASFFVSSRIPTCDCSLRLGL